MLTCDVPTVPAALAIVHVPAIILAKRGTGVTHTILIAGSGLSGLVIAGESDPFLVYFDS